MKGWVLYKRKASDLSAADHGVNHLLLAGRLEGISMQVYTPESFDVLVCEQGRLSLFLEQEPVELPDFVIPRLGADISYFGLALLRELEALGVYVCNSADAIGLVKDKMLMSQCLRTHGLPTPKTMLVKFPVSHALVERELGFPVVIKTNSGAKGYGIYLCESADSFNDLMELISVQNDLKLMILQQFIASSCGRDVRVFTLGDKVIGCMQRIASHGFKANYSRGARVEAYPITPALSDLALKTARLFGLSIAGIDVLFDDKGGFTVCEANSSPGFKGMESVMGVNIATEIIRYIKQELLSRGC